MTYALTPKPKGIPAQLSNGISLKRYAYRDARVNTLPHLDREFDSGAALVVEARRRDGRWERSGEG
ncbi:MAG: hypothetical protein HYX94_12705 [Chloroflexi bacterium]|nr:hypothetical protein [Chloroflexota bacterium]